MTTPSSGTGDTPLAISDVPSASRYEARLPGRDSSEDVAFASYTMASDVITFVHTHVPHLLEGHHLGSRLVQFALDDARGKGLRVVATCPFVAAYIDRHPAYRDLLVTED